MRRMFFGWQLIALTCVATIARSADWPQFRGPAADGVAAESQVPAEWSPDSHVKWKIQIPGYGWSCPIILGDKVFVTTAVTENQSKPSQGGGGGRGFGGGRPPGGRPGGNNPDADDQNPAPGRPGGAPGGGGPGRGFGRGGFGRNQPPDAIYRWEVHCLDRATGETIWKKVAVERKPTIPIHSTNTYASETPVTDGEHLYVYFGMTGLYCYDLSGNLVWSKELESYPMMAGWGTGSSPALAGDMLIIQCDNEEESYLAAFDKRTGEEKWRVPRDEKSSWCTPFVWKNKTRTELVVLGATARSHDPATGEVLWELPGFIGRCNASPVADEEKIYFGGGTGPGGGGGFGGFGGRPGGGAPGGGAGQPGAPGGERGSDNQRGGPAGRGRMGSGAGSPLVAVRAGATGKLSLDDAGKEGSGIAWSAPRGGPSMASPLLYQGYIYVLEQRGSLLTCYDAKDGQQIYRERLPGASGFTASPFASGDRFFCIDGNGRTFAVQAGPKFELLTESPLDEMCWTTPSVAGDTLLIRTEGTLYSFKP